MESIPFQIVQNSIDNICNITEEGDLEKASHHLFEAQPELAGFFMEFIQDMGEGAQDLGFMMALILNKSFEDYYKDLPTMTEEEVIARFEQKEEELESYLKMDDAMLAMIQEKSERGGQPDVLNYIVEELFLSPDAEPALEANEQIHLFIICKFFVDCLDELARQDASPIQRH